jgi:hypothetical protein
LKNIQIAFVILFKVLIAVAVIVAFSFFIREKFINIKLLLGDISSVSVMVSFIATLYTLVSAFVLIEVWNQYNGFGALVDKEALLLKSLWKYTDYFNDENLDKSMLSAITKYVEVVEKVELKALVTGAEINTPSKETEGIGDAIDMIKFNDGRDSVAFSAIIKVYDDFIAIRNEKNAAGITRLPFPMRFLFLIFSFLLVVSFGMLGFNDYYMYIASFSAVTFGVIVTYTIINDLDNPLGGLFSFETSAYKGVLEYMQKSKHEE